MSEEYDLKKSKEIIGQLYPILEAKDGEVIDGFHRQKADGKWKRVRLMHIDTEEKKHIARIVANHLRRNVPKEEREKNINDLAEIYQKQGYKIKPKNEIEAKIVEATGLGERTIRLYLLDKFKRGAEASITHPPRVPASQRIKTKLGSEIVERHREEVKEELLEDEEFQQEATKKFVEKQKLKSEEEAKKTLEDLGIPPVGKQIEEFYKKLPPPKPQIEKPIQQSEMFKLILGMIQEQNLQCPKCGETKIVWKCGHEFK